MKTANKDLASPGKRQFLTGLTAIAGAVVANTLLSDKAIAAALAYKPDATAPHQRGKVFSANQLAVLAQVCAVVIPATDTPGAFDVDCHGFIDDQLFHCHPQSQRIKAIGVLKLIEQTANNAQKKGFTKLNDAQQLSILNALDLAQTPFTKTQTTDFKWLKALICFGYYTSEVGASKELNYQAVPGGYKPLVMDENNDKNWGSLAYY